MKLLLKESPNTDFVFIAKETTPDTKEIGFTKQELTDPLVTFPHGGRPVDKIIVRILKIGANKVSGFTDWQEAKTFLEAIPDVVPVLAASGLTLEEALASE